MSRGITRRQFIFFFVKKDYNADTRRELWLMFFNQINSVLLNTTNLTDTLHMDSFSVISIDIFKFKKKKKEKKLEFKENTLLLNCMYCNDKIMA